MILAPDRLLVTHRRPGKVRLSLAHTRLVLLVCYREFVLYFLTRTLDLHIAGEV